MMLAWIVAPLVLGASQDANSLTLKRGAPLPMSGTPGRNAVRYWAVEDTFLDATEPDRNFGGAYTLDAGPKRTVLIRFGDLNRAVGPGMRIRKAALILTPAGGMPPVLKSVAVLKAAFGEGPMQTLKKVLQAAPDPKATPPRGAATWKSRMQGLDRWEREGAIGGKDTENVLGVRLQVAGDGLAIEGLDTTFESMRAHPEDNHGVAISFESDCQFYSSQAPAGRPALRLELEPMAAPAGPDLAVTRIIRSPEAAQAGSLVKYLATVKNLGNAASGVAQATWQIAGNPLKSDSLPALAPGEEKVVELEKPMPVEVLDPRFLTVGLKLVPTTPEPNPTNNSLTVFERGLAVQLKLSPELAKQIEGSQSLRGSNSLEDWGQSLVQLWNETVAPQSRFSYAVEGCVFRVRLWGITTDANSPAPEGVTTISLADLKDPVGEGLRAFAKAGGVQDADYGMQRDPKVQVPGAEGLRTSDRFGGLLGWGDTRFEGMLAATRWLPNNASNDLPVDPNLLEATDLLNGVAVATLNFGIVKGSPGIATAYPKVALMRVTDRNGRSLAGATLEFFFSDGSGFPAAAPFATRTVPANGNVLLPLSGPENLLSQLSLGRGLILVQAKQDGEVGSTFLKAWQLIHGALRATGSAVLGELKIPLAGGAVDRTLDLAESKMVRSSVLGDMSTLVAAAPDKLVSMAAGDWVEIDLGRDRSLAEFALVDLSAAGGASLEISAYGTGEGASAARRLIVEPSLAVMIEEESVGLAGGSRETRFRPVVERFRYLRLTNSGKGAIQLRKWIVRTLKPTP